jgi:23S rRNA-/tRNA-specific pseudouridylate synthase
VLGRHRKALARLGRLFQAGRVGKTYWAVTRGVPAEPAGVIDLPLAKRSSEARGWWMKADPCGQPAVTAWRVLATAGGLAWLELEPRTGRTHQIRVHLAELGCPVLGDPVYGAREPGAGPLHLHSRAVTLPLHERRPAIEVVAAPPRHVAATLGRLGVPHDRLAAPALSAPAAGTGAPGPDPAARA